MRFARSFAAAAGTLLLVACMATVPTIQWDPVFPAGPELTGQAPVESMGMVFGSVGLPRQEAKILAAWVTLSAGPPRYEKIEIHVSRGFHSHHRPSDHMTDLDQLWTFSGRLPPGQYVIEEAGVRLVGGLDADPLLLRRRIAIEPTVPVTVSAGGTVYLGRWTARMSDPKEGLGMRAQPGDLRVWHHPMFSFGVRNAQEEDLAMFERHRAEQKAIPAMTRPAISAVDGLGNRPLPRRGST